MSGYHPSRFGGWSRGPLRRASAFLGLPGCRLPERPVLVGHDLWQLAVRQYGRSQLFEECPSEIPTSVLGRVWVHDSNGDAELLFSDSYRYPEVGIVGDHDGDLAIVQKRVQQEMRSQIHIGALLLGPQHLGGLWPLLLAD